MRAAPEPESPSQFAFRIVEAYGENNWYAAIVNSQPAQAIASDIAADANEIEPESAVSEQVLSLEAFEKAVRCSVNRIWIGWGFEKFDVATWAKLDRDRTRLERAHSESTAIDSTIVVLVLSRDAFASLQGNAPNLASWIGGSVFALAPEVSLSTSAREARLEELRRWGNLSDADVILQATEGRLPADPYYAEWLVLLDRGDLLGNG